ncbi:MAG: YhjD/YihY/BrkB family envelope integrity protein [Verrucomicrobiota bacterium]
MGKLVSLLNRIRQLVHEIVVETVSPKPVINRLRTIVYFFVLLWRGFSTNRCPIRAAALSYTTLLALVPMLAVGLSVSKNFLHDSSAELVPKLMDQMFAAVAPELDTEALTDDSGQTTNSRQEAVAKVQSFIDNINAGALGTVGTIFLVFVGVRLLMTVEQTFNDIWGVTQGRSIWRKIVYYWATVTLGPMLLILAVYWTGRAEFLSVVGTVKMVPGAERVLLRLLPFGVLWVAFALLYALMPNTRVRPVAAIAGGVFAGTLWQVNNLLSTLYVSRVVGYSKIYGALGILPVLLVGLYFSWLIILLGAQVSYAVQNIRVYLQQRVGERIDQRGRELLACRTVLVACDRFVRGEPAPTLEEVAERINAPAQWLNQLVSRLTEGGLLVRVANDGTGLVPARAPETMTIADVLAVVRTNAQAIHVTGESADAAVVATLLGELQLAERRATANLNFRDLTGQVTAKR